MNKTTITTQELFDKCVNHVRYGRLSRELFAREDDDGGCSFCVKGMLAGVATREKYYRLPAISNLEKAERGVGRNFSSDERQMLDQFEAMLFWRAKDDEPTMEIIAKNFGLLYTFPMQIETTQQDEKVFADIKEEVLS